MSVQQAPEVKAKRLTAQQAVKLWEEFYDSHGAEQMLKSYGWHHAPQTLYRRGMRVYVFTSHENNRVGWGSIELRTWDALDDEAFLSSGVFPDSQRHGYHAAIMSWLVAKARTLGADFASRTINKVNEEHYNRIMKLAHTTGSGWVYAGDIWWPTPGHGYFVFPFTKEESDEPGQGSGDTGEAVPS
jgi:GNAT superfamily N-acetyltransferase